MAETDWKKGETLRDYDRRVEDDAQAAFLLDYAKKKQVCKKNPFFLFKRKEKGL